MIAKGCFDERPLPVIFSQVTMIRKFPIAVGKKKNIYILKNPREKTKGTKSPLEKSNIPAGRQENSHGFTRKIKE